MSKRHHAKQVAKVQQCLSGECDSLLIIAFESEADYLRRHYPVRLHYKGSITEVPGLNRYLVVQKSE